MPLRWGWVWCMYAATMQYSLQMLPHRKCRTRFTCIVDLAAGTRSGKRQQVSKHALINQLTANQWLLWFCMNASLVKWHWSMSGHKLDDNSLNFLEALGLQVDVKSHCNCGWYFFCVVNNNWGTLRGVLLVLRFTRRVSSWAECGSWGVRWNIYREYRRHGLDSQVRYAYCLMLQV